MKKLNNPFLEYDDFNCFGCSTKNTCGLQMEFYEDGEDIVSTWNPDNHYQGYNYVLHGGIQSTLIDEIASWVVFVKVKTGGVTSKMEVKFKKPVFTDKGSITLRARLQEMRRRIAVVHVELFNADNILSAEGTVYYYTYNPDEAKEKLMYPGYEQFFEES